MFVICVFQIIAQCSDVLSLNPGDAEKKGIVQEQQQQVSGGQVGR